MADEADLANSHNETMLSHQLQYRKPVGPQATGFCLLRGCGEPLEEGKRWCSAECREIWELDQRTK